MIEHLSNLYFIENIRFFKIHIFENYMSKPILK